MKTLVAFVRLSRMRFLTFSPLTYAIGIAFALHEGIALQPRLLVGGLAVQLLVQLSVSYMNDYWDMPTDRVNTARTYLSGGSGILTSGVLPPYVALIAAIVCQASALVGALWLGPSAVSRIILACAIFLATFYTAPPLKLSWRGLGELTTAVVGVLLVPQWAYSIQSGHLSGSLFVLSLPLLPITISLFLAISTPDHAADRQAGKHTLATAVGENRVAALYAPLVALGFAAAMVLWIGRLPASTFAILLPGVPLASWAWSGLRAPLSRQHFAVLLMIVRAGLVELVAIAALSLGLYLA